jgi:protein tyrosine phosphatase
VSAFNGFSGNYVYLMDTSPPDIPLLNGDPESGSTNDTITLKISLQKPRGQIDNRLLLILITDKNANRKITAANYSLTSSQDSIKKTIGDIYTENFFLESGTSYNVTILLLNTFQNKTRSNEYSYLYKTLGLQRITSEQESNLLGLLALLLIIPIAAIIYMKRDELLSFKKEVFKRSNTSTEVLDIQEDQIPLSDVAQNNVILPVTKKMTKPQPVRSDSNISQKTSKNPPTKPNGHSKRVKITEFEQYVKESIASGELERQHALFPRGQTKPWTVGSLKENKSKNRYNNLIAYDHTRVILEKIDGNPHSDYINANYVDGYRVPRAYIATQGPKAATLDDFWRMIWQENVQHIANLANIYEGGKKKVEKYWPEINETLQFGAIAVQHQSSKVYADYEHRVFKVTRDAESRELDQFHFSSWPDHGVPLYSQSLVPFLQKMLQIPLNTKSPIVVHCSAGVGRTGTILLCDICLRMAARKSAIDALGALQRLREQRPNMVDNMEQYKLAHLVVLECLIGMHTGIQCNEIQESVKRLLEDERTVTQMQYLEDTQWQDQAMKSVAWVEEEAQVVEEKNRFKDIIPETQGRVFITRYPTSDGTSSYINAVKVDGFRCPGRYIVTQQPMPNTLGDFWRLVEENNVSVVVSLNQVDPKDKTSCAFWPTNKRPQMDPVPIISLKHVNTLSMEHYDVVTIHLSAPSRKEHFQVHIISMKNWPPKTNCPKSPEKFLAFWEEADNIARRSNPVLVTCYDGVTASGLFMAMSFVIEKMKLEQICDVCQAVRTIRHNRQQFVQNIEQFEFLYRVAVIYINGFEPYANFNPPESTLYKNT